MRNTSGSLTHINELDDAIHIDDKHKIVDVADRIVNYTLEHFSYEEALMEKSGYMLLEPHKVVHDNFKKAALGMQKEVNTENYLPAARKMRSDLTVWLTNHIKREDADYAEEVVGILTKPSFFKKLFGKKSVPA